MQRQTAVNTVLPLHVLFGIIVHAVTVRYTKFVKIITVKSE